MKRILKSYLILAVCMLVTAVTGHAATNDANPKIFARTYNVTANPLLVQDSSILYLSSNLGLSQQISVDKKGNISGTWAKDDFRNPAEQIESTVTFTGKIKKVKKSGKKYTASYSFVLSDGATCKGNITFEKIGSLKFFSLKGKITLAVDGNPISASLIGS